MAKNIFLAEVTFKNTFLQNIYARLLLYLKILIQNVYKVGLQWFKDQYSLAFEIEDILNLFLLFCT